MCGSDHDPDGWVVALLPGEVRARLGGESGFVQLRGAGGRGRHRTPITRPITRPMFGSSEELAVAAAVPVVGALDVLNDVTAEGPGDSPGPSSCSRRRYFDFVGALVICPRISPPGFFAV